MIMLSPDRELFGVKIRQETKTGFLNLSDLQNAYNTARPLNDWTDKQVLELITRRENRERIYYILSEQGIINLTLSKFIESCEESGTTKYLKTLGVYKTKGARKNKTTWCNPYIWVLAAMELNPMIYAKTVIWLADNLIISRIEAGNLYRGFTSALTAFPDVNFAQIAKALNWIVFGKHEAGIRQTATASQLNELADIEKKMAWAIDMGYIETQEALLAELRKVWTKKYNQRFSLAA